jgi:hypothetical protein
MTNSPACATCAKPVEGDVYFTEVNPAGSYGMPQVLVCDDCLMSDVWAGYRARKGIIAPGVRDGAFEAK